MLVAGGSDIEIYGGIIHFWVDGEWRKPSTFFEKAGSKLVNEFMENNSRKTVSMDILTKSWLCNSPNFIAPHIYILF